MWKSRTVCLAGLASVVLGLGGCVIDHTDDSAFSLEWALQYVEGGRVSCTDAGTPTVRLQAQHTRTANSQTFTWNCGEGGGVTEVLPVGQYEVTVSLLDREGRAVSAIDGSFEVRRHGLTHLDTILFKVQSFRFSWILVKNPPNPMMPTPSCRAAGATTVELITQLASEAPQMFAFPCEQGEGVTQAIRLGSYAFWGRLLNGAGQVIHQTGVGAVPVNGEDRPQVAAEFQVP